MIKMTVGGTDDLKAALALRSRRVRVAVARGTTKGAVVVQGHARDAILRGEKSGRVYKRGATAHRASAPGEAPANDTGNLANHIVVVAAKPANTATSLVIADTEYAAALENGTKEGTIAERPFMRPAVEASRDKIDAAIKAEVQAAL